MIMASGVTVVKVAPGTRHGLGSAYTRRQALPDFKFLCIASDKLA